MVRPAAVFKAGKNASLGFVVISGCQERQLVKTIKLFTEQLAKVVARRVSMCLAFPYLVVLQLRHIHLLKVPRPGG
jgi:hypothetical protein